MNVIEQATLVLENTLRLLAEAAEASDSVQDGVELGDLLSRTIRQSKNILASVKKKIRERAQTTLSFRPGKTTFTGPTASCIVTVSPPRIVLRKGIDIRNLKVCMGAYFSTVFATSYSACSDFGSRAQELPVDIKNIAMAHIDLVDTTPKVCFLKGAESGQLSSIGGDSIYL